MEDCKETTASYVNPDDITKMTINHGVEACDNFRMEINRASSWLHVYWYTYGFKTNIPYMYTVFRLDDQFWDRIVSILDKHGFFSWAPKNYTERCIDGGWFWSANVETEATGLKWYGDMAGPEKLWDCINELEDLCLELYYDMEPDLHRIYDIDVYYSIGDTRRSFYMNRYGFFCEDDIAFGPMPGDLDAVAEIVSKYPLSPKLHDSKRKPNYDSDITIRITAHGTGAFFLNLPSDSPQWVRQMCDELRYLAGRLASDPGRERYRDCNCVNHRFQI